MRPPHLIAVFVLCVAVLGVMARDSRKGDRTIVTPAEEELLRLGKIQLDKALAILRRSEQIDLYSLFPVKDREAGFRGWQVLGKTAIKDKEGQKILSVAESIKPGAGARCFFPRHGIRATAGARSVDLVICFECSWAYIYVGEEEVALLTIHPDHQPVLDKILMEANVPLPPPGEK